MSTSPEGEDFLAAELRREANDGTPEFSESLHARVMQEVRASARARLQQRFLAAGLAAAIAMTLGLWMWHSLSQSTAAPQPIVGTPPPLPRLPAMPQPDALERELLEGRLLYLEQDAQRFGRFLLDQVAVAPRVPAAELPRVQ